MRYLTLLVGLLALVLCGCSTSEPIVSADDAPTLQLYDVGDLLDADAPEGTSPGTELARWLIQNVRSDESVDTTIEAQKNVLIVRSPPRVHANIVALLQDLRNEQASQ